MEAVATRPLVVLLKARKVGVETDPYQAALNNVGFDVLFSPLFSFTWTNHDRLAAILLHPEAYFGLIFTSQRSIESLGACFQHQQFDDAVREAWKAKPVFAVGPETKAMAQSTGFKQCVEGSEETGSGHNLAQLICSQPPSGLPLLFLCGDSRRPELPKTLLSKGVPFTELAIYMTRQHEQLGIGIDALQRLHAMVFFSPAGARTVHNLMSAQQLGHARLYAIGPTTAAEVSNLGLALADVAKKPTPEGLVDVIRGLQ